VFICFRTGFISAAALALIALITHYILTWAHMLVHIKVMIPNSPYEYKMLMIEHKKSTRIHRFVSYLVTFKFSLMLVSHFCNLKKYSGEYSAINYRNFGRFALAFIFISCPMMLCSCGYFLYTDGFWSYAGHVAIEVIILSTIMSILLLLDAFGGCYCGKAPQRSSHQVEVKEGAEYESDDDTKKRKPAKQLAEYGDEDDSRAYLDQDN